MLGKAFLIGYCVIVVWALYMDPLEFQLIKKMGVASSMLLALAGNSVALGSIFNTVPATSVLFPRIAKHSFLGVIMCELNTLLGLGFSWMITHNVAKSGDLGLYNLLLGFSGIIVGFSTYYSSISIGMICAAISVVDGKDSEAFSKLIVLEFIPTITGVFGFVVGMCVMLKAGRLFKTA